MTKRNEYDKFVLNELKGWKGYGWLLIPFVGWLAALIILCVTIPMQFIIKKRKEKKKKSNNWFTKKILFAVFSSIVLGVFFYCISLSLTCGLLAGVITYFDVLILCVLEHYLQGEN